MKKIFKLIVLFLVVFFSVNYVYAEGELTTAYNDGSARVDMPNYGVNKKWTITDSNRTNVLRTPKVDASLKIYDYADILTSEDEVKIKALIDSFIERTNMDMVFLTYDMPYTLDSENEDYAADFYDYNDFGLDFEKYSGVILIRNNYAPNKFYNVHTFGEAQLYFDYDRCENMLDDIYSYFSTGDYVNGFNLFVSDFLRDYESGKALKDYYVDDMGYIHKDKGAFKPPILIIAGSGAVVTAIGLGIMIKKNKMVKKAKEANDYMDKSSVLYKVKNDQFLTTITTRHRISSDSSGGGGGHSSHSGSSGGGHGGGGGRHG